jgi:hypothetical protein
MKDSELRGIVLRTFYDARHKVEWFSFEALSTQVMIDRPQLANICEQLEQCDLITWRALKDFHGTHAGMGKITAQGVDVVEGTTKAPITITLTSDQSISVFDSTNVQIGNGHVQNVRFEIEKVVAAVDGAKASDAEKSEAKSLLERLLSNPLILSAIATIWGGPGSAS